MCLASHARKIRIRNWERIMWTKIKLLSNARDRVSTSLLFPQNVRPSQRFLMRCRCRCHCLRSIQSLDQRLPLRLRIQYFVFSFVGIHLTKNETCILFIIYGSHQQNHPLKAQNQQRKKTIYVLIFYCFEILNPDFDNSIPLLYIFFLSVPPLSAVLNIPNHFVRRSDLPMRPLISLEFVHKVCK